nr:PREDICTED: uncharacterized protein LOC100876900 [Megachile rotundata]
MSADKPKPISFPIKPPGPPKVWSTVEAVIKGKGDKPIKFTIQDIPEDRYDDVVKHMCTYFVADEPMCKCLNRKELVDTYQHQWKEYLQHGLAIGAFTENPDGGKPVMAAVNVLKFCHIDDDMVFTESMPPSPKLMWDITIDLTKKAQVYEKYGVDRYIGAFGLSVHPEYRGVALGGHLLRTRVDIGREYKIPVTSTIFSSPIAQKLAERCGFETLVEQKYEDMVDEKGNPLFRGIESESAKIMARRLY